MKFTPWLVAVVGLSAALAHGAAPTVDPIPPLSFDGIQYLHRWSGLDQFEFTPEGQEDLDHFADMLTVDPYMMVKDGDGLAKMANGVLANYKKSRAIILGTHSVPRTPEKPAEHFIAAVFGRPDFLEAVFARFRMVDGVGCAYVYSHRLYGKAGPEMSKWLSAHGQQVEKALMNAEDLPSPVILH